MQTASNSTKQPNEAIRRRVVGWLAVAAATALTGCCLALWWSRVLAPGIVAWGGPGPIRPAQALLTLVAAAAFALGCWLVLSLALDLIARLPGVVGRAGEALAAQLTPRLARQLIAATMGLSATTVLLPSVSVASAVSVAAPVIPGANATGTAGSPAWSAPTRPQAAAPDTANSDPGWVAPAPTVRPGPSHELLTGPGWSPTGEGEIVVHRGDTLWDLTARHLGPDATGAEIAAEWPRWYEANKDVIGSDPDLLLPGQVLRIADRTLSAS